MIAPIPSFPSLATAPAVNSDSLGSGPSSAALAAAAGSSADLLGRLHATAPAVELGFLLAKAGRRRVVVEPLAKLKKVHSCFVPWFAYTLRCCVRIRAIG